MYQKHPNQQLAINAISRYWRPVFLILSIFLPALLISFLTVHESAAAQVIVATNINPTSQTSLPISRSSRESVPQQVILIVGDSLSSAYGFERSRGWVALLQTQLQQLRYNYRVVNASISGETTQGGLQRIPALLEKHKPAYVIIELGGNDGLRGLSLQQVKSNLDSMITKSLQHKATTILAGIKLPPNYGLDYTRDFYQVYVDLADRYKITLIPFLLEGVATNSKLMQADGIHPLVNAQEIIRDNVWEAIEPLLNK